MPAHIKMFTASSSDARLGSLVDWAQERINDQIAKLPPETQIFSVQAAPLATNPGFAVVFTITLWVPPEASPEINEKVRTIGFSNLVKPH
jgi:hypothetical protein